MRRAAELFGCMRPCHGRAQRHDRGIARIWGGPACAAGVLPDSALGRKRLLGMRAGARLRFPSGGPSLPGQALWLSVAAGALKQPVSGMDVERTASLLVDRGDRAASHRPPDCRRDRGPGDSHPTCQLGSVHGSLCDQQGVDLPFARPSEAVRLLSGPSAHLAETGHCFRKFVKTLDAVSAPEEALPHRPTTGCPANRSAIARPIHGRNVEPMEQEVARSCAHTLVPR